MSIPLHCNTCMIPGSTGPCLKTVARCGHKHYAQNLQRSWKGPVYYDMIVRNTISWVVFQGFLSAWGWKPTYWEIWKIQGTYTVYWEKVKGLILISRVMRSWLVFGEDKGGYGPLGPLRPRPGKLEIWWGNHEIKSEGSQEKWVSLTRKKEMRIPWETKAAQCSFRSSCVWQASHAHRLHRVIWARMYVCFVFLSVMNRYDQLLSELI